jgi:putative ABC transport system permease protein
LRSGEGVALSRDLGRSMGVSEGDEIVLNTPTGERHVQVLALVPYFSGMTGTIAMSLDKMSSWFSRPGASDLEIAVAPGADPKSGFGVMRKAWPPG